MSIACIVWDSLTKYKHKKYQTAVCNKSLHCSIPVSGDIPGWTTSHQISFWKQWCSQEIKDENIEPTRMYDDVIMVKEYKINEKRKEPSTAKQKNMEDPRGSGGDFMVLCALCLQTDLATQVNQYLTIRTEKKKLRDPYAMGICRDFPGKTTEETLVGYVIREV